MTNCTSPDCQRPTHENDLCRVHWLRLDGNTPAAPKAARPRKTTAKKTTAKKTTAKRA